MKLGRTPRELLTAVTAAELAELFAYHALMREQEQAERENRALSTWEYGDDNGG